MTRPLRSRGHAVASDVLDEPLHLEDLSPLGLTISTASPQTRTSEICPFSDLVMAIEWWGIIALM